MHLGAFKNYIKKFEIINNKKYFTPTNLHSACWILEKRNLKKAFSMGINHNPKVIKPYNIKCTACTEFYTKLTKLIPIGNVENLLIKHLTSKYFDKKGNMKSITLQELKKKI